MLSCRREIESVQPQLNVVDAEELWLDQISHVLLGVYRDSLSLAEVNATIATEFYQDERVLFKDLLYPETSELYKTEKFKQLFPHEPRFGKRFLEVLNSGQYPFSERYSNHKGEGNPKARTSATSNALPPLPLDPDWMVKNSVNIYYPYSEAFVSTTKKITSVRPPSNYELPSNTGYRDVYTQICPTSNRTDCYRAWEPEPFTVNDEYAYNWPTHITNIAREPVRVSAISGGGSTSAGRRLVKVGAVKCTRQLDSIWNGGPDFHFVRAEAYVDVTSNAAGRQAECAETISRMSVRRERWVGINQIWDTNWVPERTEQALIVYEWDVAATYKFQVNPKIKIFGAEATAFNFEVTYTTYGEPRLFTQANIRYEDFWDLNKLDTGYGLRDGFAIYKGNSIYFNMPVQIY